MVNDLYLGMIQNQNQNHLVSNYQINDQLCIG
jgi:hypothetical protein